MVSKDQTGNRVINRAAITTERIIRTMINAFLSLPFLVSRFPDLLFLELPLMDSV